MQRYDSLLKIAISACAFEFKTTLILERSIKSYNKVQKSSIVTSVYQLCYPILLLTAVTDMDIYKEKSQNPDFQGQFSNY